MKKKRITLVMSLLLIVILVLAGCGSKDGGGGNGVVPIKTIKAEVQKNQAAAAEKYQDKTISISGIVTQVRASGQRYDVYIGSEKQSIWTATCMGIPNEDALSLKAGDKVTITGDCSVVSEYAGLQMYNCYLGTEKKSKTTESSEEAKVSENSVAAKELASAEPFSEGFAWVQYANDDGSGNITALIDKKGKIIFKEESEVLSTYPIKDGYAYYVVENDDFVIIDTKGKKTYESSSDKEKRKNTVRTIKGYGEGQFVYIDHVSSVSEDDWTVGVIDQAGKETGKSTALTEDSLSNHGMPGEFMYLEKGFYMYSGKANFRNDMFFYDSLTGTICSERIVSDAGNIIKIADDHYFLILNNYSNTKQYCIVNKKEIMNSVTQPMTWTDFTQGGFGGGSSTQSWDADIRDDSGNGYSDGIVRTTDGYYDKNGAPTLTSLDIPGNGYVGRAFSGGYAPVIIKGVDDKWYITVIDNKGKQQCDPIEYPAAADSYTGTFQEGYLFIELKKATEWGTSNLQLMDTKGKLIDLPLEVTDTSWNSIRYSNTIADGFLTISDGGERAAYVSVDGKTIIGSLD